MFDVGWTEMLVIACVAIIVVGPKDLPGMLRTFGKTIKGVRGMASDFQKQFDDALREADLEDVKSLASKKSFAPLDDVTKSAKDFQDEVRARLNNTHKEINTAISADNDVAEKLPDPVVVDDLPAKETKNTETQSDKAAIGEKKVVKSVSKPTAKAADKPLAKASAKPVAKVAAAKSTKSKQVKNS